MKVKHTEGNWHVVEGGKHWNNPAIENYRIHAATSDRGFDVAWSEIGELVVEHVYEKDDAVLMSASKELLEALRDMLAGWKYIRETHGDLHGVGWDRAQDKASNAIKKALGETE